MNVEDNLRSKREVDARKANGRVTEDLVVSIERLAVDPSKPTRRDQGTSREGDLQYILCDVQCNSAGEVTRSVNAHTVRRAGSVHSNQRKEQEVATRKVEDLAW